MSRGSIEAVGENLWRVRYRTRDESGKIATHFNERVEGTRADAMVRLTAKLAAYDKGERKVVAGPMTVADYLAQWNTLDVRPNVGAREIETTESYFRNHIVPLIGNIRLDKLTDFDVTKCLGKCRREGNSHINPQGEPRQPGEPKGPLNDNTVRAIFKRFKKAMAKARKTRLILVDPAEELTLPKELPPLEREKELPEPDTIRAWIEGDLTGSDFWLPMMIELETGMRRCELLALRFRDVGAPPFHAVTVAGSVVAVTGKAPFRKAPKSKASVRTLKISPELTAAIAEHRAGQDKVREAMGAAPSAGDDLLFSNDRFEPLRPGEFGREINTLIKARFGTTLHGLRHAYCSYQMNVAEINPKLVQKRMGHANVAFTLSRYTHLKKDAV